MATAIYSAETCSLDAPSSRRFYVHVGSFGFLVAAQPSNFPELAHALALSGASRALDQVVQDWEMFSPTRDPELRESAIGLHRLAADTLRTAFQCIVHLNPQRYGSTELLLGPLEQISAWCYEDGYLTYATDEDSAAIMYAETGSLRELRSKIRRSPDFDPGLQMFSGNCLFLWDAQVRAGKNTALFYRKQAALLLRSSPRPTFRTEHIDVLVQSDVKGCLSTSAQTFDGNSVLDTCLRRASLMVSTLLREVPALAQ
jgi:hypothetical protein